MLQATLTAEYLLEPLKEDMCLSLLMDQNVCKKSFHQWLEGLNADIGMSSKSLNTRAYWIQRVGPESVGQVVC